MSRPTRRTFLLGTSALALTPALVACRSSSEGNAPSGRAAEAEENAFPATITHKFGETEVTEAPKRVVVVGLIEQDVLLALGIVPVATANWFGDAPGRIFPWAEQYLGDADLPEVLDPADGIPVEKVIGLAPDLIIGTYSGMTKAEYDQLSEFAPTIPQSGAYDDYAMPWDEWTISVGTAVGQPEAAQRLVDDAKTAIADVVDAHPDWQGLSAVCVTPYEGLGVYAPDDPRGRMLRELGFQIPEALGVDNEFFESLSTERTAELAGLDVVVWLDYDDAPGAMVELFEGTDTYRDGRYFSISDANGAYYVAQSFVTPLSVPYTLERYVPQLEAAVDGEPDTEPPSPTS